MKVFDVLRSLWRGGFDAAAPEIKAAIVAGICGVFAVFCGFALYLVFAHALEEGDAAAKLAGIAVGVVLAMAVAAFGHRLWEAIDDGELHFARPAAKTVIATISLLIVFEFSASAFEDLARATLGDFDSIRRIAGDIAGRNDAKTDEFTSAEAARLLPILQAAARRLPRDCPDCVTSPASRLITMIPPETRFDLFAPELKPSDEELRAVYFKSKAPSPNDACRRTTMLDFTAAPGATAPPVTDTDVAACRKQLEGGDDASRAHLLRQLADNMLADYSLFDAEHFRVTAEGEPLVLGQTLVARLSQQKSVCETILKAITTTVASNCLTRLQNALNSASDSWEADLEKASPFAQTLVSPSIIRLWNRELLAAAFPKAVERAAMNWLDLALLFIIWCMTGGVVGVALSLLASDTTEKALDALGTRATVATMALTLAAAVAAALLVAVRIVRALIALAHDPSQVTTGDYNVTPRVLVWFYLTLGVPPYAVLLFVILGAAALVLFGRRWWRFGGAAVLLGLALSNIPDLDGVGNVVTLIAMAWVVPTFGLALLAPYLKPGAKFPWAWGIAALLLAAAIALFEASLHGADLIGRGVVVFSGLALIAIGLRFMSRVSFVDLTPIWAVTVALFLVGGTAVLQEATFNFALRALHTTLAVGGNGGWDWTSEIAGGYIPAEASEDTAQALSLQLWLSGAVGFWLTIALLLTWSLKTGPKAHEEADHKT